jgi:hypothetical protein
MSLSFRLSIVSSVLALGAVPTSIDGSGLQSQDLYRFRSVGEVEVSPDGRHIAYAVTMNDRPGRPYTQIWIMDLVTQRSARIGTEKEATSHPRWSPDGKLIAFMGGQEEKPGLMYAQADGSRETFLTATASTNSPLPGQGKMFTWSPDIFLPLAHAQTPTGASHALREADRLRGAYGPYRANNDLLYYHLDVRVEPAKRILNGKNVIRFAMLKPDARIQLDLVPTFNIDKIVLDGADGTMRALKYERAAGRTVYDFAG